jgi:tetratricopeptide (TPR) repeat protein
MARKYLVRARDMTTARLEALLAKHDVEILLGDIEDEAGNLDKALEHFQTALELAHASNDPVRLARVNEALGILEARQLNTDAAERYLTQAGHYYSAHGNVINAVGMTSSNIAFAYLMARRYRDAIAPAQRAIAFFQEMNQPYELSLNEANLAEAYVNLGDAEQAESHAWRAMAQEEAVVQPQCLYVLAHARRLHGRFDEAGRLANEAITAAEANSDPWSRAYALRALSEAQRDDGKPEAAREAFERAREAFEQLGLWADAALMSEQINALSDAASERILKS